MNIFGIIVDHLSILFRKLLSKYRGIIEPAEIWEGSKLTACYLEYQPYYREEYNRWYKHDDGQTKATKIHIYNGLLFLILHLCILNTNLITENSITDDISMTLDRTKSLTYTKYNGLLFLILHSYIFNTNLITGNSIAEDTSVTMNRPTPLNYTYRNLRVPEMWRQSTAYYTGYWAAGWQNQW